MNDDDVTLPSGAGATRGVTPFVARTPASQGPATGATPRPGRFTPGSIIAGRYRLVALLGRGGMGEVYRAEDLTLDQTVALKFLPEHAGGDPARLTQFHNELRIARQVSHRNVVRLYDLGEYDGRRFLTMEYVDGEDLGSLLRRIGRFPEDRALAIARQLCAGVAAAHDRGVIHRDLKPANVMIDGQGDVRITDFGIAAAADEDTAGFAGTPQYMAPEQLTGSPASVKTDIYALGLILFEVFTGKRAHETYVQPGGSSAPARSLQELKALHETGTITTPSTLVKDLDPAVERVILRCLDRDPARRPASALAIAVSLPGGDPLAAALEAGETPSPEVLAAAAETEALSLGHALALLAVLATGLTLYALVSPGSTMASLAPLEKAPAVLADRAQQIAREFGYPDKPFDTAQNFIVPPDFRRWIVDTDQTLDRWNPARHPMAYSILFWHRTSPRDMEPVRMSTTISSTDPPLVATGQDLVVLDMKGRLVEFRRVPPQREPAVDNVPVPDWDVVFRAAGVDRPAFQQVAPEWSPKDFADTRAAWEGPLPDAPDLTLRLEAAAYRGRIVSVYSVAPWARPRAQMPLAPDAWLESARRVLGSVVYVSILIGGIFAARHHLRTNRADRRGAVRLASGYVILQVASWVISAHHQSTVTAELGSALRASIGVFAQGAMLWVLYLALEPYGRRFWPDGLLGWTRLLAGHVRDPRIGRDILIGSALASGLMVLDLARPLAPLAFGRPPGSPVNGTEVETLDGFARLFGSWTDQYYASLQSGLIFVILLVAARLLIRQRWLAFAVALVLELLIAGGGTPYGGVWWLYYLVQLAALALINFAVLRFGVLAAMVMILVENIPTAIPIVLDGPSWARLPGQLSIALVVAIALFGFYAGSTKLRTER